MATITEDYVSFETAKLLKEKGFDKYPLFPCYKEDNGEFIDIPTTLDTINYYFISAPTLQMVMKWLRKEHRIFIEIVHLDKDRHTYYLYKYYHTQSERYVQHTNPTYSTYEEACEAAIKYCLENLI